MVNLGWEFATLMAMSCDEFGFWFDAQEAYSKRQSEATGNAR